MSKYIIYIQSLVLLALLYSCAEQRPLSGGPKDTQPPRLDSSRYSTPNLQTNFREKEIILTFNEWVVLNDASNQILISPPLQNKPEVKIKHKSIVLKFKEDLQPNTTYTLQFGEAVKDFTENNAAQNLRFVFSTGPVLDSLTISGQIIDALTGTPAEKVWVMMYDKMEDSTPYKERPLYIAKTDAQGMFKFENIREDSFRVFAILDNNNNYKFDQKSEAIAFHPEPIFLSDSTQGALKMRLFKEEESPAVLSAKLLSRNQFRIVFNRAIYDNIRLEPLNAQTSDFKAFREAGKDTLLYWWKGLAAGDSLQLRLEIPALSFTDTLTIKPDADAKFLPWALVLSLPEIGAVKTKGKPVSGENFNLHPKFETEIDLSRPLATVNFDQIVLVDTLGNQLKTKIKIDSLHPRRLRLQLNEVLNIATCELRILPNALTDIWGESNSDTLRRVFKVLKEKDLGNMKVKVLNADSSASYIVQLLDDKELPIKELYFSNRASWEYAFPLLEPKRYSILIIQDKDKNGRLTGGDYLQKRQPEPLTRSKPITLRADWDNEMEIDMKPTSKKMK